MYLKIVKWLLKKCNKLLFLLNKVKEYIGYEIYMDEFGFKESDIYIVTYPRSGTTMLQVILHELYHSEQIEYDHIYKVSPWVRNDVYTGKKPNGNLEHPRVIKTHDTYDKFDQRVNGKIIFVIRDGREAMFSYYKQQVDYGQTRGSFDQFLEDITKREFSNWFVFNSAWLENKKTRDVLYLEYEELVNNKSAAIQRIISFIGKDVGTQKIDNAIQKSAFEVMKNDEVKYGNQPVVQPVFNNFIREGKSGKGEEVFSKEQNLFYNKFYKEVIQEPYIKRYPKEVKADY